jgi:hypothetical protein
MYNRPSRREYYADTAVGLCLSYNIHDWRSSSLSLLVSNTMVEFAHLKHTKDIGFLPLAPSMLSPDNRVQCHIQGSRLRAIRSVSKKIVQHLGFRAEAELPHIY